ncbi:MAG: HPr(Ser) kinase/phosphatase [Chlamydiia bacterium]|nr:HPr(Ser) kinase/phosphatase [Chlamydiia bacterium]
MTVQEFYETHASQLDLEITKGAKGMDRLIKVSHIQRPGLSLAGYATRKKDHRILVFGKVELSYLKDLSQEASLKRLKGVITDSNPAVIVTRGLVPPRELIQHCREIEVPLLRTSLHSMPFITKLMMILSAFFSPKESVHGTLIEAFGIGVLIQGDSCVGKSEAALGLIERGHRLISDDVVILKRGEERLIGSGPSLNKHLLELRGIGIVNIAHLYGAISVREEAPIDLVIHLEDWNQNRYYDRVGLEERFVEYLGTRVPLYLHPVKPGRDIVLLIETTILNHRLKEMGHHSAKEFNQKLLEEIARKKNIVRKS